jgi:hypothetical protein
MFKDVNFKLAVISVLMEDGHFVEEAEALKAKHGAAAEEFKPIEEVMAFYRSLEIPEALLATVKDLSPDGGDLAYVHAMTEWDGEDDTFDITSIEGIERLVNLESFTPLALMAEGGIDYTPLLGCKKLEVADISHAKKGKATDKVVAELEKRGVELEG